MATAKYTICDLLGLDEYKPMLPRARLLPWNDVFIGVEVEVENWSRPSDQDYAVLRRYWTEHNDGSLRGASKEYVFSAPLRGVEAEQAIQALCDVAKRHEWMSTHRTAIHVHLNARDKRLTTESLRNFLKLYLAFEEALYSYCGQWRKACGFSQRAGDSVIVEEWARLIQHANDPGNFRALADLSYRYMGLNLQSLVKHGTIEFRHLPTTFEVTEIYSWINIITSLYARCLEEGNSDQCFKMLNLVTNTATGADYMQRFVLDTIYPEKAAANILPYMTLRNVIRGRELGLLLDEDLQNIKVPMLTYPDSLAKFLGQLEAPKKLEAVVPTPAPAVATVPPRRRRRAAQRPAIPRNNIWGNDPFANEANR